MAMMHADSRAQADGDTEADGTARVGARVQRSTSSAPAYIMTGSYQGYTNMRMQLESGNASIMTLPCP